MDLSYGTKYDDFRNEVTSFLERHKDSAPKNPALRSEEAISWQKTLIEAGYFARTIPAEYGGHGGKPDILKSRIIAEEFASRRMHPGMGGQGISMLVPTLLESGTEAQKKQFIQPTLHGEMLWCQGYSEPGAGSDLAALRTARPDNRPDGQGIQTAGIFSPPPGPTCDPNNAARTGLGHEL